MKLNKLSQNNFFRLSGKTLLLCSALVGLSFTSPMSGGSVRGTMHKDHSTKLTLTMNDFGLSSSDLNAVLQKTVDFADLKVYYPTNQDSSLKTLNFMQYPTVLPNDIDVSKAGKAVNLIAGEKMAETTASYFAFRSISGTDSTAKVNFNYYYDYNSGTNTFKIVSVSMELTKSNSVWTIVNSSMKGDTK